MRIVKLFLAVLALVGLAGCVQSTTVIKLKPDGSGTIEETNLMSKEKLEELTKMAKQMGGEAAPAPEIFKVDDAKNKAAKLGEGVTCVSAEKISTKDAEGLKAVYAFKDITKLTLSQKPESPQAPPPDEKEALRFKFAKLPNGNASVMIVYPAFKPAKDAPPSEKLPPPDDQQLEQIKKMFDGLKISMALEVDGKVVKTNATHVAENTVTLMEMDFGELIKNTDKLKEFASKNPQNIDEIKALVKDIKGFKFNLEPEVSVEFGK